MFKFVWPSESMLNNLLSKKQQVPSDLTMNALTSSFSISFEACNYKILASRSRACKDISMQAFQRLSYQKSSKIKTIQPVEGCTHFSWIYVRICKNRDPHCCRLTRSQSHHWRLNKNGFPRSSIAPVVPPPARYCSSLCLTTKHRCPPPGVQKEAKLGGSWAGQ